MFSHSIRTFPEKGVGEADAERVNPVVSAAQAHRGIHFPSQRHNRAGLQQGVAPLCETYLGCSGGRDRDRAGDQEERELLECARRTRDSSTGTPRGGVNQRTLY